MTEEFFQRISYRFNNYHFFEEAITHPSFASKTGSVFNYQRLEFLGDTVLALVIAEWLIKDYPSENEGQLSKRQAYLISGEVLSEIAAKIGVGQLMKLSNGEEILGGRANKRNLENALEALIGAIYLDSGFEACKNFIRKFWQEFLEKNFHPPKDPTSELQEIIQAKFRQLPEYEIKKIDGSDHQPTFLARVMINGENYFAQGKSKKEAQKNVAIIALEVIKKRLN